ncbi:MAG: NmrA family NAD(P)-binding protein [Pseudomonadota bacterium]
MNTITILGAAGRIGEACAQAFLAAGWRVRGVARGTKLATLVQGVEPVEANAMDRKSLIEACRGSDIILHALNPAYDQWEATVMPFAHNVLAAAKETGATVMIPGNVYNYGTTIGMDMCEDRPFAADTSKGKIRVEVEQLFADAADGGVRTIVLRGGDFFGGKRLETWLDLMILKDLKKGKFVWPGPYDLSHAFAYLPDFAETFVRVANKRQALPAFSALNFEGHTLTGNQMKRAVEEITGKSLKSGNVPWFLIRLVGLFNPVLKAVVEMSYLWRVPHSMDGRKLAALVDVPKTPIAEALRQTIADQKLGQKIYRITRYVLGQRRCDRSRTYIVCIRQHSYLRADILVDHLFLHVRGNRRHRISNAMTLIYRRFCGFWLGFDRWSSPLWDHILQRRISAQTLDGSARI